VTIPLPNRPSRFLPTLTEVVHPSSLSVTAPSMTSPVVLPASEDVVQTVMQQVDALIDRRLREETEVLLRELVLDQVQRLRSSLQEEIESAVRQSVADALTPPRSQY
jgi:sensor domain CHASE-containing protein